MGLFQERQSPQHESRMPLRHRGRHHAWGRAGRVALPPLRAAVRQGSLAAGGMAGTVT